MEDETEVPQIPIIDFTQVVAEYSRDVYEETYQELGDVRNEKLQTVIDKAIAEFNRRKPSTLFTLLSENLDLLLQYVKSITL